MLNIYLPGMGEGVSSYNGLCGEAQPEMVTFLGLQGHGKAVGI